MGEENFSVERVKSISEFAYHSDGKIIPYGVYYPLGLID